MQTGKTLNVETNQLTVFSSTLRSEYSTSFRGGARIPARSNAPWDARTPRRLDAQTPGRPSVRAPGAENFKRPKNREDSSDFDQNLTESTAATRSRFRKNLLRRCCRRRRRRRRRCRGRWNGGAKKFISQSQVILLLGERLDLS